MKRIMFILFLAMISWNARAQQQIEPLKQNIDFHIDSLGNAHVTVTMKLDAAQWDNFKRAVGDNVAILKRSMERAMPAYFLDDFRYSEDAMNESYTLKFNALGVSKIDQQGNWVAGLDSKSPDVTKITDHLYLLNSTYNSGGSIIEQDIKVSFPKDASDITVKKDAFGKAFFSFTQPKPGQRSIFWVFSGGIFLIVGLSWGYLQKRNG